MSWGRFLAASLLPPRPHALPSACIVPRAANPAARPARQGSPPRPASAAAVQDTPELAARRAWRGRGRGQRCQSPRGARAARLRIRPPPGAGSAGGAGVAVASGVRPRVTCAGLGMRALGGRGCVMLSGDGSVRGGGFYQGLERCRQEWRGWGVKALRAGGGEEASEFGGGRGVRARQMSLSGHPGAHMRVLRRSPTTPPQLPAPPLPLPQL